MNRYKLITSALNIITNIYTGPLTPSIDTTLIVKNICHALGFEPNEKQLSKDVEDTSIIIVQATMYENTDICMTCQKVQIGKNNTDTFIFIIPEQDYISDSDNIGIFISSANKLLTELLELNKYKYRPNTETMDHYIRLLAKIFFLYLLYYAIYEKANPEDFKGYIDDNFSETDTVIKNTEELCKGYTIDWKGMEVAVEDYFINCKAISWLDQSK